MARLVNLMVRCGADFSALSRATKSAKTSMKSMQKTSNLLKTSLKFLGAAIGAASIIGFGKACANAASDLQEVQNVVDVTFAGMTEKIDSFAQNAIRQFGLSETASKRYTGTMGAMLKSMGLSTDTAAEMSMTITGLAGDLASFYNLSADDAFYKIRAGISGETEPLKALGINMSIANLEAYALSKGITTAYRSMTQAQQAVLRYNYLLSVTTDAQGDFARTSGSWANQVRLLTEQFNQLKVAIGTGLIQALTPVIQVINQVMAKLVYLAQMFSYVTERLFGKQTAVASSTSDAIHENADAQQELASGINAVGKAAKKALAPFDELTILQENTSAGGGGSIGTGFTIPEIPDIGGVAQNWTAAQSKIQESTNKVLAILAGAGLVIGAILTFSNAAPALGIGLMAVGATALIAGAALNWDAIRSHIAGSIAIVEMLLGAACLGIGAVLAFTNVALPLGVAMMAVGAVGLVQSKTLHWDAMQKELSGSLGKVTAAVSGALLVLGLILACSGVGTAVGIGLIFAGCAGLVTTASVNWDTILNKLKEVWSSIQQWFNGSVKKYFTADYWNSQLAPIKMAFQAIWFGIKNLVKNYVNGMIQDANSMIRKIVEAINAIGTLFASSSIGAIFGFSFMPVTPPAIPYLASGAVIPPNREFLAVLGDQRHGTNIEAPLSTIEEAVHRASGSDEQLRLLRSQNDLLRQILEKTGFSVDGKQLYNALAPYQRQAQRAGGW